MRPTTIIGLCGMVVAGIMMADIWTHPSGTQAAAQGLVSIITPTESALLGTAPK